MAIADKPSVITMPPNETRFATVLAFLAWRFPGVSTAEWQARMLAGKVFWDTQHPIKIDAPYSPHQRIFYFREVIHEPAIPFEEGIIHQDNHLLVACKPHFLPVTPGGRFVEECLVNRLRKETGIDSLSPIHRIDRETAGLVMLSVNPDTRSIYHGLFAHRRIKKTYYALAHLSGKNPEENQCWEISNKNDDRRAQIQNESSSRYIKYPLQDSLPRCQQNQRVI